MWTWLAPKNRVLGGGLHPFRGRGSFGEISLPILNIGNNPACLGMDLVGPKEKCICVGAWISSGAGTILGASPRLL